ncbi:MAG TPA: DUF3568 family protein [Phycisphaerae bacterium]|jgi:hypothetical protein|nr:DUF3568 family protein [Phycisphaerae bacterium]
MGLVVRAVGVALLGSFACVAVASLPGCEVASAAGDVVGSSFDAIQTAFRAGKLERFGNVSIADSIAATRAAGEDLQLHFVRTSIHPDQQKIVFQDMREQDIVVTLVRRTGHMTEIRVDVGLFGPEGFSRLMLDRIIAHMPTSAISTTRTASEVD